jgi:hypothetical protein
LNGLELYQDYKDIIISLKRAKQSGKKLEFSPKGLLKYVSSMGLEAYKTLAIALQFLLTLPLSVVSCVFFQQNETDQIVSAVYSVTIQIHKPCYSFN